MKPDKAFEAIDTLVQGMDTDEQSQLFEHLRDTYPEQLGPVAVNGAGAEAPVAQAEIPATTQELITSMAEKFGVKEGDFSVLAVEAESGETKHAVVYTAENGIDLDDSRKDYDKKRSWNSIFDKKNDSKFKVKVGRKTVDTRTGMTEGVYRAFIADAKTKGVDPLPDSPQLADQNGEVWTDTWLTGEEAARDSARIAYVFRDGQVYSGWFSRGYGYRERRFRPAVVVE